MCALESAAVRVLIDSEDFFVLYAVAVFAAAAAVAVFADDSVGGNLIGLKAVDLLLISYHYLLNLDSNPF